jgi:hypothetical protein
VKPVEPLPANANIAPFGWVEYEQRFVTDERIDEVPPTPPSVSDGSVQRHESDTACGMDSCGNYTFMTVKLSALGNDDVTAPERLVYAVFVGSTAAEAATKTDADRLHSGDAIWDGVIYEGLDASYLNRDVFVSFATLDESGNLSARTAPIQIHSAEDESCTVSRRSRGAGRVHWPLAFMAVLGLGRRSFRPRRIVRAR